MRLVAGVPTKLAPAKRHVQMTSMPLLVLISLVSSGQHAFAAWGAAVCTSEVGICGVLRVTRIR